MEYKAFINLLQSEFDRLIELTQTKGKEYSRDVDILANFKRLSLSLQLPPEKVLFVYLQKHLDSITSFVSGGVDVESLSEPIDGRISDAILYLILLKAIINEGK